MATTVRSEPHPVVKEKISFYFQIAYKCTPTCMPYAFDYSFSSENICTFFK